MDKRGLGDHARYVKTGMEYAQAQDDFNKNRSCSHRGMELQGMELNS